MRIDITFARTIAAALAVVVLCATPSYAGFSVGGSFAAPSYGARSWGMGGATIASGANEESVYWNPAMLGMIDEHRLGVSYSNLVPGTQARQSYAAYAQSLKPGPVDEPGLEFAHHAIGAIYGNLSLELADGQSYSENTLRLSYAYTPLYFMSFGVSFVGLTTTSDIEGFGSTGTALDASIRLAITRNMTFAAVLRNALSQLSYDDGSDLSLPRSTTFGLAYQTMPNLLLETDIEFQFGGISKLVLGGEYTVYHDVLALRAGLANVAAGESRTIGYVGAGVRVRRFYVDYSVAFDNEEAFGRTQRFSLGIGF